ncbi:MAG: tRNA (adenosine(37)-N6)-dimethylallyltransferase MiaA [Armatimonadota bacterium]|nr:tRNA (adenosine(37)-N6)-dimethylallyltransferase MiaA [Armatimonadota bacterium]
MIPHGPLIVICGPTAVGKTAASIEVAKAIGGEIICADSRTVYRYMDIGTAKPTEDQRRQVPHHLLDVADPSEVFTVVQFVAMAEEAIRSIHEKGKVPLLVGGTGLYIRAVVDGLTIPMVPPNWELRSRLEEEARKFGPEALHRRLAETDPVAAQRIHPGNVRRVIRALEVYAATGRPISSMQSRKGSPYTVTMIGLTLDRPKLYARIADRVYTQIHQGLVEEVRSLLARGYSRELPAMQGLGYKEIAGYLQGEYSLEEAIRRVIVNTRRYAKRQFTWFLRDPRIQWIDVDDLSPPEIARRILGLLGEIGARGKSVVP